jgi:hypothetical protein
LATSIGVGALDVVLDDQVAAGKVKKDYQNYARIGLAVGGTLINYFVSLGPTLDDVTEAIALSSIPLAMKSAKAMASGALKYENVKVIERVQRIQQPTVSVPAITSY